MSDFSRVGQRGDDKTGQCNYGGDFAERAQNRYCIGPESEQGREECNAGEHGGE